MFTSRNIKYWNRHNRKKYRKRSHQINASLRRWRKRGKR